MLNKYGLKYQFEAIAYEGINIISRDYTYNVDDQFSYIIDLLDNDGTFTTVSDKTIVEAAIMSANYTLNDLTKRRTTLNKAIENLSVTIAGLV